MAKKKQKWTAEQVEAINRIQEQTGVTRKTAIRKMLAAQREHAKASKKAAKMKSLAVDAKMAAANDKPEVVVEAATISVPRNTAEQVSAARSEGVRLFGLAGRPTKEQFITVYGERGAKMTWVERAKASGLATAEEAAKKFQSMLAKA